jgi:O-antigen ligase
VPAPLDRRTFTDWKSPSLALILGGLLVFSYPPLVVRTGGTNVLRPDWILALPFLVLVVFLKRELEFRVPSLLAGLLLFVLLLSSALSQTFAVFDFLTVFSQFVFAVGLFVLLSNADLTTDEFRYVLRWFVVLLSAIALYTIYQAVALNLGLPIQTLFSGYGPSSASILGYSRPTAVFSEPGYLASVLLLGIAIMYPCVATDTPLLFRRRPQRVILFLLTAALLSSGSFGGVLTLLLAFLVFTLIPSLRPFTSRVLLAGAGVGLIVVLGGELLGLSLLEMFVRRFEVLFDVLTGGQGTGRGSGSITIRRARYLVGIVVWSSNPLFGVGLGQYAEWVLQHGLVRRLQVSENVLALDGGYIQMLTQTGLIGLVTFLGIWVAVLRTHLASVSDVSGPTRTLVLVGLCVVVVNLIDWAYAFSAIHTVRWSMLGLVFGYTANRIER